MRGQCIICSSKLHTLFQINNMPASAQDIPGKEELEQDRGIDVSFCQCESCSLVQLDIEPVWYYKDVIRAGGYSTTMRNLRKYQYEKFIDRFGLQHQKIIEFGCGGGEFLSILAEYPVQAYGLEHKRALVEEARTKGLNVFEGFQEDEHYLVCDMKFKAFCSFNFLEHQPKPLEYLRAIYHNLEDEAYGLITVPSFEYIMEEESFYEIIPDHIAYYTEYSISHLLHLAGFEVLDIERVNRDTISLMVQKKVRDTGKESHTETADLKEEVEKIIKNQKEIEDSIKHLTHEAKAKGKSIAVWGASHQGFTLLSTTGIAEDISYIIDSAPFKQGKFAPASHIEIISKEEALMQQTDIIIIVAPGYVDEIHHIIRNEFLPETTVYALRTREIERL